MNSVLLPRKWKDWEIIEEIGEGTCGVVYQVEERNTGKKAAIKVITISSEENESSSETDLITNPMGPRCNNSAFLEDQVARIQQEIDLLYQVKGNSNIVAIYDYEVVRDDDQVTFYIMMESLTDYAYWWGTHDYAEMAVIDMGIQLCHALESCEKLNILHRDLKPENILVNDGGQFKLTDFSAADTVGTGSVSALPPGTVLYMAPEVLAGKPYTRQADLYSLGLILYQKTNKDYLPFIDINKQFVLDKDLQNSIDQRCLGKDLPSPINASPDLAWVIKKACSFNETERYASAKELRAALLDAKKKISAREKHTAKKSTAISTGTGFRKVLIPLIAITAAIAVGIGIIVHIINKSGHKDSNSTNDAAIAGETSLENVSESIDSSVSTDFEITNTSENSGESETSAASNDQLEERDNTGASSSAEISEENGIYTCFYHADSVWEQKVNRNSDEQKLSDGYHVGDSLQDGPLRITYVGMDDSIGTDESAETDGCFSIALHLVLENISTDEIGFFDCYSVNCYADNVEYSICNNLTDTFITLTPGRYYRCDLCYQIPENTKEIEFSYKPEYLSDQEIIFDSDSSDTVSYNTESIRTQTENTFAMNDTVDGMPVQIQVVSEEESFEGLYGMVDNGYHYLSYEVTFTNKSDDMVLITNNAFLLFADGEFCSQAPLESAVFTEPVEAGRSYTATVSFEVPEDAHCIELEYAADGFPGKYSVIRLSD